MSINPDQLGNTRPASTIADADFTIVSQSGLTKGATFAQIWTWIVAKITANAAAVRTALGLAAVASSGSAADLSTGTLAAGRLPLPSSTTLGGVQSKAAVASNWLTSISTSGVPAASQPTFADIGGTLAVAGGGTGDTGTAWATYTPTVTAQTGTITTLTATGRAKTIGKTTLFEMDISITAAGSGAGFISASLPSAPVANYAAAVIETTNKVGGAAFTGTGLGALIHIYKYDGTTLITSGLRVVASGIYEAA